MKLVKMIPAVAATLIIAACSNADANSTNVAKTASDAMKNVSAAVKSSMPTFETAAYFCDVSGKKKQVVSATYAFVDGKIDTATITINRKVVGQEMKLDPSYQDGTKFVEGNKVWSLESGFTQATASKVIPIMFTDNNRILARNCEIAK